MTNKTFVDRTTDTNGAIVKVPIDRITIDPELSTRELLKKIETSEKEKKVKILAISYEGSFQSSKEKKMSFGKDGKLVLKISESTAAVPKRTIKVKETYTLEDLIGAFEELESWLIEHKTDYTLDAYPTSLIIVDLGMSPNFAPMIVKFEKRRKIDKDSEVGMMLKGAQKMPLDAVIIYNAEFNKKIKQYKRKSIPSKLAEEMKQYEKDFYILPAEHVKNYTRNLYDSEFTIRTQCIVGKQTKQLDIYESIENGTCKIVPK